MSNFDPESVKGQRNLLRDDLRLARLEFQEGQAMAASMLDEALASQHFCETTEHIWEFDRMVAENLAIIDTKIEKLGDYEP